MRFCAASTYGVSPATCDGLRVSVTVVVTVNFGVFAGHIDAVSPMVESM